jgi:hypothetical protein
VNHKPRRSLRDKLPVCVLGRLREEQNKIFCGQPSYRVIKEVHLCRMHWDRVREIAKAARQQVSRRRLAA